MAQFHYLLSQCYFYFLWDFFEPQLFQSCYGLSPKGSRVGSFVSSVTMLHVVEPFGGGLVVRSFGAPPWKGLRWLMGHHVCCHGRIMRRAGLAPPLLLTSSLIIWSLTKVPSAMGWYDQGASKRVGTKVSLLFQTSKSWVKHILFFKSHAALGILLLLLKTDKYRRGLFSF
jgi:hypothetical protein